MSGRKKRRNEKWQKGKWEGGVAGRHVGRRKEWRRGREESGRKK